LNEKAPIGRFGEVTVNSNWIMATGMAVVLVFCSWQFVREVRDLVFGSLAEQVSFPQLSDKIGAGIAVVYPFLFACAFRATHVRVAFVLLGTTAASRFLLTYVHASPSMLRSAAIGGSIANQIALTIIVFAIVQWFKSVVRWIPPPKPGGAKS
jgi:hypothetical protein